jgi:hypothetical protein
MTNLIPVFLILKFVRSEPIHIVLPHNPDDDTCIIIPSYRPDKSLWAADFKNKIK